MVKHLGREELLSDGPSSKSPPLKRLCQSVQVGDFVGFKYTASERGCTLLTLLTVGNSDNHSFDISDTISSLQRTRRSSSNLVLLLKCSSFSDSPCIASESAVCNVVM